MGGLEEIGTPKKTKPKKTKAVFGRTVFAVGKRNFEN